MIVVGVDPGRTTGVFRFNSDDAAGTLADQVDRWVDVPQFVVDLEPDVVVYERFLIGPQTLKLGRQYEPLYCIGALVYVLQKERIPFHGQTPNERYPVSDEALKRLGWWRPSMRHAMDAAAHTGVWCLKERLLELERVMNG